MIFFKVGKQLEVDKTKFVNVIIKLYHIPADVIADVFIKTKNFEERNDAIINIGFVVYMNKIFDINLIGMNNDELEYHTNKNIHEYILTTMKCIQYLGYSLSYLGAGGSWDNYFRINKPKGNVKERCRKIIPLNITENQMLAWKIADVFLMPEEIRSKIIRESKDKKDQVSRIIDISFKFWLCSKLKRVPKDIKEFEELLFIHAEAFFDYALLSVEKTGFNMDKIYCNGLHNRSTAVAIIKSRLEDLKLKSGDTNE